MTLYVSGFSRGVSQIGITVARRKNRPTQAREHELRLASQDNWRRDTMNFDLQTNP
jgi:hypothetical protein